jgi:histidine triad (HIT) family protein
MEDDLLSKMILFAKSIAPAIKKGVPCKRIGLSVIGLEVPHAHLHMVPMNTANDVNFTQPKINVEATEMKEIAERIKSYL